MAKSAADQAGLELPHPLEPVARGQERCSRTRRRSGRCACSDTFRWFLGGWIAHAPDVMAFYAPTVNSYKRYQSGSWAPTRLAWSHDNRTAGFRVVGERAEPAHRVPHPGRRLQSLPRASPPRSRRGSTASRTRSSRRRCSTGDVYAAEDLPDVPKSLRDATELFAKSKFARAAFGTSGSCPWRHVPARTSAVRSRSRSRRAPTRSRRRTPCTRCSPGCGTRCVAAADDTRCRAVVVAPGDARGAPTRPDLVALVGVDGRRVKRINSGSMRHPSAQEPAEGVRALDRPDLLRRHRRCALPPQAHVDVAARPGRVAATSP